MEEDIDNVVAHGLEFPEMIFHPETRVGEGIILVKPSRLEPYLPEAAETSQSRICGDVGIVIPDEACA
jgi:hypothetical protein